MWVTNMVSFNEFVRSGTEIFSKLTGITMELCYAPTP
eukprot:SAG31_NODE_767_length_12232_cov_6.917827_9_plen_37_part_00